MIQLGSTVKDKITGLTGIVMGRTDYLTGCAHVGILSRSLNDKGAIKEWEWIDETRVDVVPEEPLLILNPSSVAVIAGMIYQTETNEHLGGPSPNAPSR